MIGRFRSARVPYDADQLEPVMQKYLESDFDGKVARTKLLNEHSLKRFFHWMRVKGRQDITVESLVAYRAKLEEDLSPRNVIEHLRNIRRFLGWMQRVGIIEDSPHTGIRLGSAEPIHTRPPMTHEQYLKIRQVADGHWLDWIFLLAWNTGMSLHDCFALKWENVDMERCIIHIRRRKSGTEAIIPFSPSDELGMGLKARRPSDPDPESFVCEEAGTRIDPVHGVLQARMWIKRIMDRAGVEGVTMHSMRRSYISMLANSGMNLALASKISGHRNPKVFASYVRPDADALRKGVEEAKAKAGLDRAVYIPPTNKRYLQLDTRTFKPNRVYSVKGSRISLPDGTRVEFVISSANAEGKKAVVTPCDINGNHISQMQILADFNDLQSLRTYRAHALLEDNAIL